MKRILPIVLTFLICLVVLRLPNSIFGSDLPYGADSLPYLVRKSSNIAKVSQPERRSVSDRLSIYVVTADTIWKGKDIHKGKPIHILFEGSLDLRNTADLEGSVMFLIGPLTAKEIKGWRIPSDIPIAPSQFFLAVSGRHGVVKASNDQTQEIVKDFIENHIPEERMRWADGYLNHKDAFLQRSAVLELGELAPKHPELAIPLLGKALMSEFVIPENKVLAINGLGGSGSRIALDMLKEIATKQSADLKTVDQMRLFAIQAVAQLPGGLQVLQQWQKGTDKVLAPKARELLNKIEKQKDADPPLEPSKNELDDLLKRLQSPNEGSRREAVSEVKRCGRANAALLNELKVLVENNKEASSLRLLATDTLGHLDNAGAATALSDIARNPKQSCDIRKSAILAIWRMSKVDTKEVLGKLAKGLEESDVKALAAGLADK